MRIEWIRAECVWLEIARCLEVESFWNLGNDHLGGQNVESNLTMLAEALREPCTSTVSQTLGVKGESL